MGQLGEFDAVVVGAGIVGAAAFRELCRLKATVLLLDRLHDVGGQASRANTGILHGGYDPRPGSTMAAMNARGTRLWFDWAATLDIDVERCGSLVLAFNPEDLRELEALLQRGRANGVTVQMLEREEVLRREPSVNSDVKAALYSPFSGIIDPFRAVIALVGNGIRNGGRLRLDCPVGGIEADGDRIRLRTELGEISTGLLINAAGLEAGHLMRLGGDSALSIHPRRGQYLVLDKNVGPSVRHVLFPAPSKQGKGIVVTRTTHGNVMIGPTAEDLTEADDATTLEGLAAALAGAKRLVPFPYERATITQFAGLRSVGTGDFTLQPSANMPGVLHLAGIKSPGLSAAPAIGQWVREWAADAAGLSPKDPFDPTFAFPPRLAEISWQERNRRIEENPAYGRLVCRCEQVSEQEVVEAIRMQPGARDLDGIKRRVRPTAGRCQGGFCTPRLLEILCREGELAPEQISKFGPGSELVVGDNRGIVPCK